MEYLVIASLFVMLASISGVLFTWGKFGTVISRHLPQLVSFSAGVFLIVAFLLARESVLASGDLIQSGAAIVGGAALIFLIFKAAPGFHHHHNEQVCDNCPRPINPQRILASDAIHNVGDGVLLAAAFSISLPFGIITTASVLIHEFLQEVSEFFVLKRAGYTTKQAALYNFLVSSTILIGAVIGWVFLTHVPAFESILFGIAAGSFFIVVFLDLIPHSFHSHTHTHTFITHIAWFLLGAALMLAINAIAGHAHAYTETPHTETPHTEEEHVRH